MRYISTRGGMPAQTFGHILLEGLAPDGGLAVPESYPQVSADTLEQWRGLSYEQLASEILSLFITDIPRTDLDHLCQAAYDPKLYSGSEMVPIKPVSDGLSLLGLSQGPTLAFKDMAMQFLGQVFEYQLERTDRTLNILGATSGDTGSAAEYALRGKQRVNVFMLSPYGRMSAFQRAQMYTLQDDNIHNLSVRGVFDDCQDIVKHLSADLSFKERMRLGAVNSINWARIAAQVVYYFWGWLRISTEPSQLVSFAVPTGNFGNILAGHIAREMGLPIHRLILATNENDVLDEFFRTGVYQPRRAAQTYETSSPSMDISKASNFERFVFDLVHRDAAQVSTLWRQLDTKGYFDLSALRSQFTERYPFRSGVSTHADRLNTIRQVYEQQQLLIDPHTADGVFVAQQYLEPGIPMLVLETALPVKFSETIEEAIGTPAPIPEHLQALLELPQKVTVIDAQPQLVRDYLEAHVLL